ncbi:MAG TPA: chemotaxis protein CheW [Opitutus sp.]|nr:chemotaxis protein CheW [Opitutus sp.]
MNPAGQFVVFGLDERRFALRLPTVERVVRVVAIDPLPKSPAIVLGVVNIGGRVTPVVDPRRRFHAPAREPVATDHLIVARTAQRPVALLVDSVMGVVEQPAGQITPADAILPGLDYVEGVVKLEDGLIFIHDLDTFLSLEEARTLDAALATAPN